MNESADIATVAPSRTFDIKHYRMDETNQNLIPYQAPEVTEAMVTKIRAVTGAEKKSQPVIDATGEHFVPWLTNTCIETADGNLYVLEELDTLLRLDPNKTPIETLSQATQLIVAVQRTRPEIVQLPEIEIRKPDVAVDASPPDGAPFRYRPKHHRQSFLGQITPTQWAIGAGALALVGATYGVLSYEQRQSDFWRSTDCTELSMSSPNALAVARRSENLTLTVDRSGRVFVSTPGFANAKQTTNPVGKATGDIINGYSVDISDAYRPDLANAAAAVDVCMQRLHPSFK